MKTNKNLLNEFILIILVLFIYFEPQMFKNESYSILTKIDLIYKAFKLLGAILIFGIYIKRRKISKLFFCMVVFQFFALVSTVVANGSISRFIGPALTTVVMIMIAEILISENTLFDAIKVCIMYFRICFVINIISIIIVDFYVKSSSHIYFLGIDNRFIFTYLPWITFEFLYSIKINNKISKTSMIMFILSEITLLYKFSVSAMIVSFLWILILITDKKIVKHAKPIFLSTIVANILIVVVQIQKYFEPLLTKLHKGTTISGRTYLWDAILKNAKNNLILGNGMQSVENERLFFFSNSGMEYFKSITPHAHNSYMTVLQRYGLLGLLLYFYIIWICICRLVKGFYSKYAKVLLVSMMIVLILSIFDTIDCSGFYFILACCYWIKVIDEKDLKEIKNENKEETLE